MTKTNTFANFKQLYILRYSGINCTFAYAKYFLYVRTDAQALTVY